MDTTVLQRFDEPGHWATGNRDKTDRARDPGYVYAHYVINHHTRLAYVEQHSGDAASAATATLGPAADWTAL